MEEQMDIENRLNILEELIKKQQKQISGLTEQINWLNQELVAINEEIYNPGQNGYPSLYDAKEKLVEKGWLKKPSIYKT
jgi:flagellar hook-associated protein FlgK